MNKLVPNLRFPQFAEEWEEKKFGNLVIFKSTNSFSRENLNYENGTVKNIHYGDIHTKFKSLFDITQEKVPFLNETISIEKIKSENYCQKGDLIFADASEDLADVGKMIEIANLNNEKLVSGLHTLLATPLQNVFSIGFAAQLFKSKKVRLQIEKEAQGTKVASISATRLGKIILSIPSLAEQTQIGNFLTAVDKRILLLKQKLELLKSYKKGIMAQIFSQELRFKDENGQEFPEWEEKTLGEVFKLTRGKVLSMKEVVDFKDNLNLYPVYSSQTQKNGLAGYFKNFLFENCITWTTDGANAGTVNYRAGKFYCTTVCGVLVNEKGYCNQYVADYLNTVTKKYVSYVGNPKLMNNVMAEISIPFPCLAEQTKIAEFLTAIDQKINYTEQQIAQSEEWKKGLLQQMLI